MAVGAAATLYHATSGRARRIARKIDYWTIAVSSAVMVKSVYADRCVGGGVMFGSGGFRDGQGCLEARLPQW